MVNLILKIVFAVSSTIALGLGLFMLGGSLNHNDPLPNPVVINIDEEVLEQIAISPEPNPEPIVQEVVISASGAYTLLDGEVLQSFRTSKRWPIASITKLMTTIVSREFMSGEDTIVITEDILETYGESAGFKLGERYTVNDLISAMMTVSSNDAAYALAAHFGEDDFISEMNLFAKNIGMKSTTFRDSSGLSPQNLSTVEDLYLLGKYIWENEPDIFSITRKKSATIHDVNTGFQHTLININKFAGRDDFLGGKTGQIPEAGGNLLSLFTYKTFNQPILIVVLGTDERFVETEKILMEL